MRPTHDQYFTDIANVVRTRATCARRSVGCVLTDSFHHILATGYNGVAPGAVHCTNKPCGGVGLPSGTGLDKCEAIHAEQNALIQCRDTQAIESCYVTASPCVHCIKMLMVTSCSRIVIPSYSDIYSQEALDMWLRHRGTIIVMTDQNDDRF